VLRHLEGKAANCLLHPEGGNTYFQHSPIPDFCFQARSLGWEEARFSRLPLVFPRGQSDRTTHHKLYD
ncbi:MAG: hypothetical protein P8X46_10800, partial [Nitrospirales bacterium]